MLGYSFEVSTIEAERTDSGASVKLRRNYQVIRKLPTPTQSETPFILVSSSRPRIIADDRLVGMSPLSRISHHVTIPPPPQLLWLTTPRNCLVV